MRRKRVGPLTALCLAARRPVALTLCLLLACDGSPDARDTWTAQDSAGITIFSGPLPATHWQVDSIPTVRIGVLEGDSTQLLVDVIEARALDDGRVVIVDAGPRRVYVYGPDGRRVASLGGQGEGPGEFGYIESAWVMPDGAAIIYDNNQRRLTRLSPGDEPRDRVLPGVTGRVRILGESDDGRALLQIIESHPDLTLNGYSISRDTLMLLAVPPTAATDTILRIPGPPSLYWLAENGSYVVTMELPFAARVAAALTDSTVVIADGVLRRLEYRSGTGELRALSRLQPDNVRTVSDADRDRFVDFAVERSASSQVDPAVRRRNTRDQIDMLPDGHAIPPFDRILSDGPNVWLRDYVLPWNEATSQTWTVFDVEGRAVARVTTPAGVTVTHVAADRITGIARGDFDEQYVVVYGLLRGTARQ